MLSVIVFVVIISLILLYCHLTRNFHHWKAKKVPYLTPIVLFGNTYSILTQKYSFGEFLYSAYKTTKSPYLGFFVFDKPFLLIRDPQLLKQILILDFDNFTDRVVMISEHDKLASSMLFFLKNKKWKTLRKMITPAFSSSKVKNMHPLIDEAGNDLVQHIKNRSAINKSVDCRTIGLKYSTDTIATCAFGIKAQSLQDENSTFLYMTKRFHDINFLRATQMASCFFAPILVKLFRMKYLDPIAKNFMVSVFTDTIQGRNKSKFIRGDLIDIIRRLDMTDFDEDIPISIALQFLLAGTETIASSVTSAFYELALHKPVQDRLRKEIQKACETHETITYDALAEIKYLDMVVKEVLRKYPVLAFLERRCEKTYKLPYTDLVIEKGTGVYVSLLGLHYDELNFPSPEKFDPDRFSDENVSLIHPFAYLPFGKGLRYCIGDRMGLLALKTAIVKVLLKFDIEPSDDTPTSITYEHNGFTLIPKDGVLNMRFIPLTK